MRLLILLVMEYWRVILYQDGERNVEWKPRNRDGDHRLATNLEQWNEEL